MKRILIIDDDAAVQSLTVKALETRGFRTMTANDGVEGLDIAKKHLPDLIICDIQMPRLNGYETLAALRQDPLTASIPFIFLTGLTDRRDLRRGMGQGADDFLTKPFSITDLMQAVNTRLERQAAVQQRSEEKLEELRSNIGMALPHEMLTPLNGILGCAAIMLDEGAAFEPQEIRAFAGDIQISALRLHRLIQNFIIYSEVELAFSDPKKIAELRSAAPWPVKETIECVVREIAASTDREGDTVLQLEDASVIIAPNYFKKVVEELVDNALKFSAVGTPIGIQSEIRNQHYVLTVSDRGRGMTAQQIADVGAHMQFERRFYEQQGAGLGLIIAKRLAELYGGDLFIESVLKEHTTVQFSLPLFPPWLRHRQPGADGSSRSPT